jgi:hypothetical protein
MVAISDQKRNPPPTQPSKQRQSLGPRNNAATAPGPLIHATWSSTTAGLSTHRGAVRVEARLKLIRGGVPRIKPPTPPRNDPELGRNVVNNSLRFWWHLSDWPPCSLNLAANHYAKMADTKVVFHGRAHVFDFSYDGDRSGSIGAGK